MIKGCTKAAALSAPPQGLHCLPVVEQNRLVGMVTQTDLIAAMQDNLLMRG